MIHLKTVHFTSDAAVAISGSKSETNRLLLLQALFPTIVLDNISNAEDSILMANALASKAATVDIHHAGTAMRFLTAYFASKEGKIVTLTGSSRMKERPIGILVEALRQLGAQIEFVEKEGFPPLKIVGKKLPNHKVTISANVSSQYISALLLIAPSLENGIELTLEGNITSVPYIEMTLALLKELEIPTSFENNVIKIASKPTVASTTFTIESDWSSASYFYSIIALSPVGTQISLSSFKENSLQGDACLIAIYKKFGVTSTFTNNKLCLKKIATPIAYSIQLDLKNTPDIAQTIAVTAFGLGIACQLTGLHTLKIKETDRLEALQNELTKLGAEIETSHDSLSLQRAKNINKDCKIQTYNDHRMAMSFAPLALKTSLFMEDPNVVTKSYPNFWKDLKSIGFSMD